MADQLETLRQQAIALAEALEATIPEHRVLGLSAAFRRPIPADTSSRALAAGMRQGLDDLLTMAGHLSGTQLRTLANELRTHHRIELDRLQQQRLRRIAAVRKRGRVASDAQWYLIRSRIDEISGLDTHFAESEALQNLAVAYERRHAKA